MYVDVDTHARLMECALLTSLILPALLVGLQLVAPRLGRSPSCPHQPDTEQHENSIQLHGAHFPEDGPHLYQSKSTPHESQERSTFLRHSLLQHQGPDDREKDTTVTATAVSYSMAWLTNIPRCLISTVGKAILTKPINPSASDGSDLIPPVADVPASLCSAPLWCAPLYSVPPRHTNSHNDAACSFVRSMVGRYRITQAIKGEALWCGMLLCSLCSCCSWYLILG